MIKNISLMLMDTDTPSQVMDVYEE
jgi:hypothetical protein